jgi:hypothetical protein
MYIWAYQDPMLIGFCIVRGKDHSWCQKQKCLTYGQWVTILSHPKFNFSIVL